MAVFDTANRSGISYPRAELYGAEQAVKVAGMHYLVTGDINVACSYSMVIVTSPLAEGVLTTAEKIVLSRYVENGGVLFATCLMDRDLFSLFGITDARSSRLRTEIIWNIQSQDPALKWFDDPLEQVISLGSENDFSLETISFSLTAALPLASYNDTSVAATVNRYGAGYAYLLGISFRNIITRNLLGRSLRSYRSYSNGFEPTSDTVMLFLRAIYTKHIAFSCWKKTSPFTSWASFIITHDLCSASSVKMMLDFAKMENRYGISADYNVNTTYQRCRTRDYGGFYDESAIKTLKQILNLNHNLASHSVNHFPDFGLFPEGQPGNTKENYHPWYDGVTTHDGTAYGEIELSKKIVDSDLGVYIRTFRSGHLQFNDKQYNVLEAVGYAYDTTRSANAVLTNFPFVGIRNREYEGQLSAIYEVPMTISDVVDDISAETMPLVVALWLDIALRNAANLAPTVLLVHPNRDFKLSGEEELIRKMPAGIVFATVDSFGDFWRSRDSFNPRAEVYGGSLRVVIPSANIPLDTSQSIVIENGAQLAAIEVADENGNTLPFCKTNWNENDLLLHWGIELKTKCFTEESWSVRKVIGELIVEFPDGYSFSGFTFTISRKERGDEYRPLKKFSLADLKDGRYRYFDYNIAKDKVYLYRVEIHDALGRLIAVSNERII